MRPGGLRGRRTENSLRRDTVFGSTPAFGTTSCRAVTPEFQVGMAELHGISGATLCAIMCAQTVWWRCHRRIISDYLLVDGHPVFHIMSRGKIERAKLKPAAARQADGMLRYTPAPAPEMLPGQAGHALK